MVHLELGWVAENVFGQVLTSTVIFLCCWKNTHLVYSPISSYGKCLEIINALELHHMFRTCARRCQQRELQFTADLTSWLIPLSSGDRYRAVGISFHLSTKQTPSLQWNNCLCILWPYSQFSVALFVCIPNLSQADTWMFKCLSNSKEETAVFIPKIIDYFCPNWSGTKQPEGVHSHDEVRQPCWYFKCSEGVFAPTEHVVSPYYIPQRTLIVSIVLQINLAGKLQNDNLW